MQGKSREELRAKEKERAIDLAIGAGDGDEEAWEELRNLKGDYEGYADYLLKTRGEMGAVAAETLIDSISGRDCIKRDALRKTVGELIESLVNGGHPLETLLTQLIVCCWLQTHYATIFHTKRWERVTLQQEQLLQRRQDRAQRRLLRAVKALAQVRKLLGSPIQINIGEKQVNVQGID